MSIIKLFRIKQYSKNLFIIIPVLFSGRITTDSILSLLIGFLLFSLLASSVYIINDIIDKSYDAKHPLKKFRPIASGQIKTPIALLLAGVSLFLSLFLAVFLLNITVFYVMLAYYFLNICYSKVIKNVVLVDVFFVAFFYIIRLFLGAVIVGIELSHWIILVTYLFALFLTFGKRKMEVDVYNNDKNNLSRTVISNYSVSFITVAMSICATLAIVSYVMYTVSSEVMLFYKSKYLFITVIFVLFGILRYFFIISSQKNQVEPSEVVLHDIPLLVTVVLWGVSWIRIIYR